jgi:hypothetical protein
MQESNNVTALNHMSSGPINQINNNINLIHNNLDEKS